MSDKWRNRIVGHGEEAPDDLLANPANWRVHPREQQEALSGAISDVGFIRSVTVNRRTGHVVDGHLRVALALRNGETSIPVEYVDLSESEELEALVTLDPIAALAVADREKLDEALREVQTGEAAVQQLLADLASLQGMYGEGAGSGYGEGGSDDDEESPTTQKPSDGSLLSLVNVTIAEPRHVCETGQVYELGVHVLCVADVLTGWPLWGQFLEPGSIFAPYAGPFVPLTVKAAGARVVMAQPDIYIAGHILDRYEDVNGAGSIRRVS